MSVVGEVGEHLPVDSQHGALANKAYEDALFVHHWQRPRAGAVERAHYYVHRIVDR